MSIVVEDEQKIAQEGLNALMKHLSPAKVARVLSLWRVGTGDYTLERRKLFAGETAVSLFAKAKAIEKRNRKG